METAHGAAERFRGWGRGVESDGGAVEDFLPEMAELAQRAGCLGTAASFPHPYPDPSDGRSASRRAVPRVGSARAAAVEEGSLPEAAVVLS